MKKLYLKVIVKGFTFLCILLAVLMLLGEILKPKMLMGLTDWPTTTNYQGFYNLEKNTVDVVFLGSSRGSTEYLPQIFYDEYGIRSYNLSCQQQNMLTSYFWLKEALRFQKPKAVILDADFLFSRTSRGPLNSSETSVRIAFDAMKFSKNKLEAVRTLCSELPDLHPHSFFVPFYFYHSRWKELSEIDLALSDLNVTDDLMGYVLQKTKSGDTTYQPLDPSESSELAETDPDMVRYCDMILELCKKEGMDLILTDGLANDHTLQKYNAAAAYAKERGVAFYDFNEKSMYEAAGLVFAEDTFNVRHCNIWGGIKISRFLGKVLRDEYGITGEKDEQWENSRAGYETALQEAELLHITDVDEYLSHLYNDRYTILIATRGKNAVKYLSEEGRQMLQDMGLKCEWKQLNNGGFGAVLKNKKMVDGKFNQSGISLHGGIRNNRVYYEISSSTKNCSIMLDGEEKAQRKNGISIVVYDELKKTVVDSVTLLTNQKEPEVYHK